MRLPSRVVDLSVLLDKETVLDPSATRPKIELLKRDLAERFGGLPPRHLRHANESAGL